MTIEAWRRLPSWVPVAIEAGYLDWSDVRPLVLGGERVPLASVDDTDDRPVESLPFRRTAAVSSVLLVLVLLAGVLR